MTVHGPSSWLGAGGSSVSGDTYCKLISEVVQAVAWSSCTSGSNYCCNNTAMHHTWQLCTMPRQPVISLMSHLMWTTSITTGLPRRHLWLSHMLAAVWHWRYHGHSLLYDIVASCGWRSISQYRLIDITPIYDIQWGPHTGHLCVRHPVWVFNQLVSQYKSRWRKCPKGTTRVPTFFTQKNSAVFTCQLYGWTC